MSQILEFVSELGPTIVGLAALCVTYRIATKQIRATTVSTSREKWVHSLQDALSRYISIVGTIASRSVANKQDLYQLLATLNTTHAQLLLMLMTDDPHHRELRTALDALLVIAVQKEDERSSPLSEARDVVLAAAPKVIDAEWTKIKQGI